MAIAPSFAELLASVDERRRTVTVYAPALPDAVGDAGSGPLREVVGDDDVVLGAEPFGEM